MKPNEHLRESYKYFLKIPTRWNDNDVYHHVNNVHYYSFFDTVINEYLIKEGGLDFEKGKIIGLAVETSCNFLKPIKFPQNVDAGLRIRTIGNSSVRYEIGLFIDKQKECAAHGYFVHVFVERSKNRPVTIPEKLRECMNKLLISKT